MRDSMRASRWWTLFSGFFALLIGVSVVNGQTSSSGEVDRSVAERPGNTTIASSPFDTGTVTLPFTPAELSYSVGLYAARLSDANPRKTASGAADTIRTAVEARAKAWVTRALQSPVRGIQLDPMGELYVAAGDEARARAQFEERIGTPGLAVTDRAYTMMLATFAFAHPERAEQMRLSTQYLDRLLALPVTEVGRWQYSAYAGLARAFDVKGLSTDVIGFGRRAMALAPRLAFPDRGVLYNGGLYVVYADALAGVSGGRAQLDSVNAELLALTTPPATLVAKDSAYLWLGQEWTRTFQMDTAMTANLGRQAAPLVAHAWWNTTRPTESRTPTTMPLADGKIRLIEFGDRYCGFCMMALPVMDRMNKALAAQGVEVWFVTHTYGFWNTTFMDPAEEVSRLKDFYRTEKAVTLPIALWAGDKEPTEDGGLVPKESPNDVAYHISGRPTFYLIDGHGFVRHISRGFSANGGDEQRLLDRIQRLIREANASSHHSPVS